MTGSVWIYTAVIGLAVTQLVAFWYLYRQSDLSTSAGATAQTHPDRGTRTTRDADHVQCPDCGAPNESTFRYCRNCVSELPRRVTVDRETGTTQGRGDAATRTE